MSNAYLGSSSMEWNALPMYIRCLCLDFCCVVFVVVVAVVSCCCCVHFFVLHRIFFRKFVDVFVNMAYRYSSGLTRFKSDIYSFHCTRIYLCVCLLFFRPLSFLYHAHKYEMCVYIYFFFAFLCLYCFRLLLIYGIFIHFGFLYFIYNLLFSVVSIRTSSLVVNCFVTVDKQNSVFLFLSFVSPRWSLKKWKYNFMTQCVIAMECLSKLRPATDQVRLLSPNFSTRDILWHQQIANFFFFVSNYFHLNTNEIFLFINNLFAKLFG